MYYWEPVEKFLGYNSNDKLISFSLSFKWSSAKVSVVRYLLIK